MFEAKLIQGSLLKRVLETVKNLLNEATLVCSKEGIQLEAMDHYRVSLMTVIIRADSFDKFQCDRTIRTGVDLAEMSKILCCCCTEKDIITMKVDDEAEIFTFTFESPLKRKVTPSRTMKMKMQLVKFDQGAIGIPEKNYSAVIKMPSGDFQRVVKELSEFGKQLVIACVNEAEVKFAAAGDNGTGNIELGQQSGGGEEEEVIIKIQEPVAMTFSSNFLNMFKEASRLANQVSLHMSPESPMLVEYNIGEIGHVRFYLAPMIEDKAEA